MFHGWITAGPHFIPFLFLSFPIHPLPYPLSATLQNHPFPAKVGGVRVGSPVSPPLFPFAICNFTGNSSSDTDDGVRRKRCWRRGIMYLCRGGPKACSFTLLQLAPLFPFPLPFATDTRGEPRLYHHGTCFPATSSARPRRTLARE